jgi:hypothetical protein
MSVLVTIRTVDDQGTPVAISGVRAMVFTPALAYLTEGLTDGAGEVAFNLDGSVGGTAYKVQLYKQGVYFAPNNWFNISVIDPPVPPNLFQFTGHVGMSGQQVLLVAQDDMVPTPSPIEGVKIRLFNSSDLYMTEVETDEDGEAAIVLSGAPTPGQKYIVRLFPPLGHEIPVGMTQEIYVFDPVAPPNTNIFDFTVIPVTIPVSGNPLMCRLTGQFIDATGTPIPDLELVFRPREGYPSKILSGLPFNGEPSVIGSAMVLSEVRATTDHAGKVDFELPREGVFDVFITGMYEPFTNPLSSVWIPDAAGAALVDVLYPYVTTVTFSSVAIALTVGGPGVEVELTVEASNKQENIEGTEALASLLVFSTDETIATVMLTEDGKLLVSPVAVGSTTIGVARGPGTAAPRSPALPDVVVLPSTPTITVT